MSIKDLKTEVMQKNNIIYQLDDFFLTPGFFACDQISILCDKSIFGVIHEQRYPKEEGRD